jgi:dienelactone hydrolase
MAKKINELGIAAIVLLHRILTDEWIINREIDPLQDVQQPIKTVRDSSPSWGINYNRIGIMGFSAGDHFA